MDLIAILISFVALGVSAFALWQTYIFRRRDQVRGARTELELAQSELSRIEGKPQRLIDGWVATLNARGLRQSGARIARQDQIEEFKAKIERLSVAIKNTAAQLSSSKEASITEAIIRTHVIRSEVQSLLSDIDSNNRELEEERRIALKSNV